MAMLLVMVAVLWISAALMIRAHLRREHHIAARYAAAVSLTLAVSFGYRAYRGETSALLAVLLGVFALGMFSLAIVKGRFHAPRS